MMCTAYFGALNEKYRENWYNGNRDPSDVLDDRICVERKAWKVLDIGNDYFRERIQIDWGSFAWKCTKEEIIKFLQEHKTQLPWMIESDEEMIAEVKRYIAEKGDVPYGMVFIELY